VTAPVRAVDAAEAEACQAALVALLEDAVEAGASIGFVPPLGPTEARDYWGAVVEAVREGARVLLVARDPGGAVIGSAQLGLEMRANGRHRAEVMKVMVHRRVRRRGIGRALMLAAEEHAHRLGRSTLYLDTRLGDPSERLYRSLGWTFVGSIPRYAVSAGGRLDANAIYYKLLARR
jgi:acetyltransferase